MTDYGYLFSTALYEKLKEKIYAGVFVKSTDNDELEVVIARKSEGLTFKTVINDLSDKLLHGYSTEYAAYEILEKYRKYIINRYFV